jgi:hypothetical protein
MLCNCDTGLVIKTCQVKVVWLVYLSPRRNVNDFGYSGVKVNLNELKFI